MKSCFVPMRSVLVSGCASLAFHLAGATGLMPETTIVQLSLNDGVAQMGVKNTESNLLLMNVTVHDLPGSEALTVLPLPQTAPIDANGRQVVRFVVSMQPSTPITKQYLKRVSFEGIPPRSDKPGESAVNINVRQTIPMVISPKGLARDDEPWKRLRIVRTGAGAMEVRNDSPYVVRLNADAQLLPVEKRVRLISNTYMLPGERFAIELPQDVPAGAVQRVRIEPASNWGFKVDSYVIDVSEATAP